MFGLFTVLTDNPHLGRFDYASLTDQMRMEMVVADFSEEVKKLYQDENGLFIDVCEWQGVTCDWDSNVIRIQSSGARGPIALEFIPPKVTELYMNMASLSGTLSTSALPKGMECFEVGSNDFEGTVDFTTLPENMEELCLYRNTFTGSAALNRLPQGFRKLWIQANNFSGSLHLKNLPPNFVYLDASSNEFNGEFCVENIPMSLSRIRACGNSFHKVAVVPSYVSNVVLGESGVARVVDAEGEPHPGQDQILEWD